MLVHAQAVLLPSPGLLLLQGDAWGPAASTHTRISTVLTLLGAEKALQGGVNGPLVGVGTLGKMFGTEKGSGLTLTYGPNDVPKRLHPTPGVGAGKAVPTPWRGEAAYCCASSLSPH